MNSAVVPLVVLAGFLGAGKTTLITRLLGTPEFRGTAFIVNEVGSVGIDQDLLRSADSAEPVLLSGGCVCCSMGADLGHTLRDLYLKRERGRVPLFARVLLETTGLADPRPIMAELMSDPWLASHFQLVTVTSVVGATEALEILRRHPEATSQVVCADRLVLSKCDLVNASQMRIVLQRLRALNPWAELITTDPNGLPPALPLSLSEPRRVNPKNEWRILMEPSAESLDHNTRHDVSCAHANLLERLDWTTWAGALDAVVARAGDDLLRIKGLLYLKGDERPVLIQCVGRIFSRPVRLVRRPDDGRRSRVVFISRGTGAPELVRHLLQDLGIGSTLERPKVAAAT